MFYSGENNQNSRSFSTSFKLYLLGSTSLIKMRKYFYKSDITGILGQLDINYVKTKAIK